MIDECIVHFDAGSPGRDLRRGDERAAVREVHLRSDDQIHVAVNSGTGIPARSGLQRIIDPYGQHILSVAADERRDVVLERIVPVGIFAHHTAVDPDLAFHVHAVEADEHPLPLGACRRIEVQAVPSRAAGHEAALRTARIPFVVRSFHAPVVRQIQQAPSAVVERRIAPGTVAQREAPAFVDIDYLAGLCGYGNRQPDCREKNQFTKHFVFCFSVCNCFFDFGRRRRRRAGPVENDRAVISCAAVSRSGTGAPVRRTVSATGRPAGRSLRPEPPLRAATVRT